MKSVPTNPTKNVAIQEVSFDSVHKEMSDWANRIAQRAYELFAASGFTDGHDIDDWFKAKHELLLPVTAEVKDSQEEVVVTADVPGFDAKDLDVHLSGSRLIVEGKHAEEQKQEERGTIYRERQSRQIYKVIELPVEVSADKATAELTNGKLQLKFRKPEKSERPEQAKIAA